MKKLLILSGKGGTGKTTAAAAFIQFAKARAFADCDVDAPNLHLIERFASPPERSVYYGAQKARIDPDRCVSCGKCASACRFGAIRPSDGGYAVDAYACEGCGVCVYVCGAGAARLCPDAAGETRLYAGARTFSTARLKMGRGNSGKLVSAVKAALEARGSGVHFAVIDGSPGIGCPVISSMSGVDMVLVVAEPSLSGLSDMQRILRTAEIFQTRAMVCINKYDVSPENTRRIEQYCRENGVELAGRIPFDEKVPEAVNAGICIAQVDCPARDALKRAFDRVSERMGGVEAIEDCNAD